MGLLLGWSKIRTRFAERPSELLGMFCLVNSRNLGKASEHAAISSFPVPAVGGTSEGSSYFVRSGPPRNAPNTASDIRRAAWNRDTRASHFQFFFLGHSVFDLSAQECDKHTWVIWRVAWNNNSYTYSATHVLCTPCTFYPLWSRVGVHGLRTSIERSGTVRRAGANPKLSKEST